jgi:hypothetical protein
MECLRVSSRRPANWLCFHQVPNRVYFHNLILHRWLRPFAAFQIGFVFSSHMPEKLRIQYSLLAVRYTPYAIRDWVCFFTPFIRLNFHKPLLLLVLSQFTTSVNWLCFFKLYSVKRALRTVVSVLTNWVCLALFYKKNKSSSEA